MITSIFSAGRYNSTMSYHEPTTDKVISTATAYRKLLDVALRHIIDPV